MRQRELAWMLYITEGYIANLDHCSIINKVMFSKREQEAISRMRANAQRSANVLRELLSITIN